MLSPCGGHRYPSTRPRWPPWVNSCRHPGAGQEAVPFLKRATVLLPDDADLHCDLGDALQTLGQLPEAGGAYDRSLQLNPNLSRWYSAGCAQNSRKEYAAAITCFRKALEIHPDWREAQHNLGLALFKLGQVEEALDLFHKAAAGGDPALPDAAIAVIIPGNPASDNRAILDARRKWAKSQIPPRRITQRSSRDLKQAISRYVSATSLRFFRITTG